MSKFLLIAGSIAVEAKFGGLAVSVLASNPKMRRNP
jgi:hypothetical protein